MQKHKIILLAILVLSISLAYLTLPYTTAEEVSVTVTGKERAPSNRGGFYMVFTKEETFKNEDSKAYLKFNSSDVQGKLELGKTYKLKVYGFRIPILSKYRNIVKIYE